MQKKTLYLVLFCAVLLFTSAVYADFRIFIDEDNNGTIDRSEREKTMAANPAALGKIIPLTETKRNQQPSKETEAAEVSFSPGLEELVEIQISFPPLSENDINNGTVEFQLGSEEISLWGKDLQDNFYRLDKPQLPTKTTTTQTVPTVDITEPVNKEKSDKKKFARFIKWKKDKSKENTESDKDTLPSDTAAEAESISEKSSDESKNETAKNRSINPIKWLSSHQNSIDSERIEAVEVLPEIIANPVVIVPIKDLNVTNNSDTVRLYLRAEKSPSVSTYQQTITGTRPTRRLKATYKSSQSVEQSDSVTYIVIKPDSFYDLLFRYEIFSQALAAQCVYNSSSDNNNSPLFHASKYCLTPVSDEQMLELGYSVDQLKYFKEQNNSGFRAILYQDHIHEKYYLAFKGTDFKFSMLEDIAENISLGTGQTSQYILKTFRCAQVSEKAFENKKDKIVIVGHSLGGALASTASIVSHLKATAFNSMGVAPELLNHSLGFYRDMISHDDEFYIYCKNRIDLFQVTQISTVNTKWDILTLLVENINTKMKLKNGDSIDVLVSAIGNPYPLNNKPAKDLKSSLDDKIEGKNGQQLIFILGLTDQYMQYLQNKRANNTKDNDSPVNKIFWSGISNANALKKAVSISIKCHLTSEIIYGLEDAFISN